MNPGRLGFTVAIAAILAVALFGCSSGEDFPAGLWMASSPEGTFAIDFRDDGVHVVMMGASALQLRQVDRGTFETGGDRLRFLTDSRCRSDGDTETAAYTWEQENGSLRLTVEEDQCRHRRALLAGAVLTVPTADGGRPHSDPVDRPAPWWNHQTFYEVFVRSFSDSDGDGNGDLQGLIQRLDYLNDLGVTALWLMPIAQSPSYHGYDTTDYFAVETDYGTNQDFIELMEAAHARGMRVIVDLVLNHTSSEHPWFLDSSGGPSSSKRDWYVWSDTDPQQRTPWGTQAWHPSASGHYLGLFWGGMPDLNYRNSEVTDQMYDAAAFWLDEMRADGFRLDAVRHLVEQDGQVSGTTPTHEWLVAWDDFIDTVDAQALTVGEVWDETAVVATYVVDDQVDLAFEFSLAQGILDAVDLGASHYYLQALAATLAAFPAGQFAPFLTNHDQDRVMSQFDGDVGKAKLAATALLTSPGVPFLYYGEEIGMYGRKPDEQIRTPMQWSSGPNAGFTGGTPWEPINGDYTTVNVESQLRNPSSLLSHYRNLLHARAQHESLRVGGLTTLTSSCVDVAAHVRSSGDDIVLTIMNFSAQTQNNCSFTAPESGLREGTHTLQDLLTDQPASDLIVTAGGPVTGFVPLPTLTPRQSAVLALQR